MAAHSGSVLRGAAFFLFLFGMSPAAGFSLSPSGGRVGTDVYQALLEDGRARVVVTLRHDESSLSPQSPRGVRSRHLVREVLSRVRSHDVEDARVLKTVPVVVATLTPRGLEDLTSDGRVSRVDLDGEVFAADIYSRIQIGADQVQEMGFTGQGVTVAVLDSGTDLVENIDLDPSLVGEECFCPRGGGCCPDGSSRQSGPGSARSLASHGPQVMGIIAAAGFRAPVGIAPGVGIFAVRVLNERLEGSFSGILEALDWILVHRPEIRLVNMSIATSQVYGPGCESLTSFNEAVSMLSEVMRERGGLFIVASGNEARIDGLGSPGCVANVLSVGAVTGDDVVAPFSNTAPHLDLLAPGVSITSTGSLGRILPITGTSAATPHVTGAAALLLSANPFLSAPDLARRLLSRAVPLVDDRTGLIFPRVDVREALAMPAELEIHPPVISVRSRGRWIEARLEPVPPFLAADLDPASLILSVAGQGAVPVEPGKMELGDGDGDGIQDWTVRFSRQEFLAAAPGAGLLSAAVEGTFFSDVDCLGNFPVRILPLRGGLSAVEPTP